MAPKVLNSSLNLPSCPLHIIDTQTGDCKSPDWEQPQRVVRFGNPEGSADLLQSCYFRLELILSSVLSVSSSHLFFKPLEENPHIHAGVTPHWLCFLQKQFSSCPTNPSLNQDSTQYMGQIRGFSSKLHHHPETKHLVRHSHGQPSLDSTQTKNLCLH